MVRNVGAHRDSGLSLDNIWLGTRIAKVHTADRRLRFSIVDMFNIASCKELNVIPKVKSPKRELLLIVKK